MTVGEKLRKAREEQNLGVQDISNLTKIRADHLLALEECNYSVFSAPVYIRGFVRTYSTVLKLDTARILEDLGRELADSGQIDPLLAPVKRSKVDVAMFHLSKFSRRMVWPAAGAVLVLALVTGGYLWWHSYQTADPTLGLGPGLYQAPANSGDTLPLPAP